MMNLFGMKLETPKFHVVELVNGKEIRITTDFNFLADAENAIRRMPEGNYAVKSEGKLVSKGKRKGGEKRIPDIFNGLLSDLVREMEVA